MREFWILVSFLLCFSAGAQQIQLIDFYSGEPVQQAYAKSKSRDVVIHANENGQIPLSYFQPGEIFLLHSDFYRTLEMTSPQNDEVVHLQPLAPVSTQNFLESNLYSVLAKANRKQGSDIFPEECAAYVEYFAQTFKDGQVYNEHFEVLGTSRVDQSRVLDFKFKNIAYQSQPIDNRLNFSVNYLKMLQEIPVFDKSGYPSVPTLFTQLGRLDLNSRYDIEVDSALQMAQGTRLILNLKPKNDLHDDAAAQVVFNLYENRYEAIRWKQTHVSGSLFESKIAGGATDHYDIETTIRFQTIDNKSVIGYLQYRFDLYDSQGTKKQTFYLRWIGFDYDHIYSPMFLLGNLNTDLASKIEYDFSAVALSQYDVGFWNDYRVYQPISSNVFEVSEIPVWSNMKDELKNVHFQGLYAVGDSKIDFTQFETIDRQQSDHLTLTFLFYINPDDRPGKSEIHRGLFVVEEGGIVGQNGYIPTSKYLDELCEHAQFLFERWFEKNRTKLLNADPKEWVEYGIQRIQQELLQYEQETQFGRNQGKLKEYRKERQSY